MDRRISPELSRGAEATFEETYPRYEFAELVRIGLAFAAWLARARPPIEARQLKVSPGPLPGGTRLAE
jgi:hypothetical protein